MPVEINGIQCYNLVENKIINRMAILIEVLVMRRRKHGFHRINKNKIITLAAFSSFAVGIIILVTGMTFYKYRISELGLADSISHQEYTNHYVMISEQADEPFWEAIYLGALDRGKEEDAYIEKFGSDLSVSYSIENLMEIAIASKVDGIILEPNGEEAVTELINKADQEGIPVITVLKDEPLSGRKSFVGINRYNQGQAYGEQILEVVKENKNHVIVLLNSDSKDTGKNILYAGIRDAVGDHNVLLEAAKINRQSAFGSEEDIRKIIMDTVNPPDVFVCLTAVDTLCANQAVKPQ